MQSHELATDMPTENLKSETKESFTFSQSSLQDYTDCPRRFQLRYLEQLAWPAVETEPVMEYERRQKEGQIFHLMAQQFFIGLPAGKLSRLANTPDLVRWWNNFVVHRFDIEGYAPYSELVLTAPVGIYRLMAKYDLVAVKSGEKALIFDWKTYHKRPKDDWATRLQTRVYRSLLVQAGAYLNDGKSFEPEQIEMIYWYPEFPSEPARFPYNTIQYQRDWDALTSLISEIGNHRHFPLVEDQKKCSYCPYRSFCNRGVGAGTMDENEAEMETAESELNFDFDQVAEIEY